MNDIKTEVNEIFKKVFNDNGIQVSDETTANDIEGWDSLTHMDLISAVENHFKIKFGLKDLTKMNSVGALVVIIRNKLDKLG
jgi:acyl carrier protein